MRRHRPCIQRYEIPAHKATGGKRSGGAFTPVTAAPPPVVDYQYFTGFIASRQLNPAIIASFKILRRSE
ncbi:MAG: hypothetical protein WCP07_08625 [bacterium]